jgi:hypothetical protein
LESYLAGHREAAVPGAIISENLFAACLGLYRFVDRIDSEILEVEFDCARTCGPPYGAPVSGLAGF